MIDAARKNVSQYDWAQAQLKRIMDGEPHAYIVGRTYVSARDYAAQSDDFMWTLQPTTRIPRIYPHEAQAICPVHGFKVREKNGFHPWFVDPIHHPYKVQCMLGGEWYPSNDFLAGDMTSGSFPDDGSGCVYEGKTYYFIREYAHQAYCAVTIPALRALSQAYLITGDRAFARKGAILLARLADEYPNHTDRADRLYYATVGGRDPHYTWKTGGMITDLIWETFCLEATACAYDGLYDALDDPQLLSFLRQKGMSVHSGADLRIYIEEHLLRSGMRALLSGAIRGNEGFHQAAAMACALVMDDYGDTRPNSADMVDYAFHGAGHAAYMLDNGLTRDGGGHESPGYNKIKLDFVRVAQLMERMRRRHPHRFPIAQYPDLFASPKARALFDHFIDLMVLDAYVPAIGDSGGIGPAHRLAPRQKSLLTHENLFAFETYGDPRFAHACKNARGECAGGAMFAPYPEQALVAAQSRGRIGRTSRLIDGYGVGILCSGSGRHARAATVNYTALIGHRQCDNLSVELFANGLACLPDLGYPFTWDYRWEWDGHLMAHNTVCVDETPPTHSSVGGGARLMAASDGVHVLTVHHDPYAYSAPGQTHHPEGVSLYERTLILVDVSPERFYLVDLFAVCGGTLHTQSWHGPLEPVDPPVLNWQMQTGGSYAGPHVPQFAEWTDRWGRVRNDFCSFIADVRKTALSQPAAWTWDMKQKTGDRVRLHLVPVGGTLSVTQGRGRSPARPESWGLDYILANREAPAGTTSRFLTVIDAFQKTPTVHHVRLVSEGETTVLSVEREGGVDELTLHIPDGSSRDTVHRPIGVQVRSCENGRIIRDISIGALPGAPGYAMRDILDVDYAAQTISIAYYRGAKKAFAPGRHVRIHNRWRTAMFQIVRAEKQGDRLVLTLDKTALMAKGPVVDTADGCATLGAYLVFGNGKRSEDGQLAGETLEYQGAWMEGMRVRGVVRGEQSHVYLMDPIEKATLTQRLGGKVASIYHYGVGDLVEVAHIARGREK